MIFKILVVGLLATSIGRAQSKSSSDVELTRARQNVLTTERNYRSVKQLFNSGSASQNELRKAEFDRGMALLQLSTLVDPSKKQRNEVIQAKLILKFRVEDFQLARQLFRKGSANQVRLRRAEAALQIAKANLKMAESQSPTKQKMQSIKAAQTRVDLIEKEFEIAQKLYQSGSLSRKTLERAKSNLAIARSELAAARQSLGASAVQVKQ